MIELTKRVANAWRNFLSSEEGIIGMQWIMEQRPKLNEKEWQQAGGFEKFREKMQEIEEFETARATKDDEPERLKT